MRTRTATPWGHVERRLRLFLVAWRKRRNQVKEWMGPQLLVVQRQKIFVCRVVNYKDIQLGRRLHLRWEINRDWVGFNGSWVGFNHGYPEVYMQS